MGCCHVRSTHSSVCVYVCMWDVVNTEIHLQGVVVVRLELGILLF